MIIAPQVGETRTVGRRTAIGSTTSELHSEFRRHGGPGAPWSESQLYPHRVENRQRELQPGSGRCAVAAECPTRPGAHHRRAHLVITANTIPICSRACMPLITARSSTKARFFVPRSTISSLNSSSLNGATLGSRLDARPSRRKPPCSGQNRFKRRPCSLLASAPRHGHLRRIQQRNSESRQIALQSRTQRGMRSQ